MKNVSLYDLSDSASLEIVGLVRKKIAAGERVFSLVIGEPIHDTPPEIITAATEAMKSGMTHYVPSVGIPEVRAAIRRKVGRKNGIRCSDENTIFISGKMAIYAIYLALGRGESEEVLIPDPGYFFSEPALLAGIRAVPYLLKDDYSLDLEDIERKITSRTRAVVINTPSNPTGKIYGESELKELLEMCSSRGVKIISDEAYEDLTYGKDHVSIGSLEDSPSTVISVYTLSKSYSMTGWRAGYVVADEKMIGAMAKYMDHAVTCFPPFIQHASAVALDTMDDRVESFRLDFQKKREFAQRRLSDISGITLNSAEGAFYLFPGYDAKVPSLDIANSLLEDYSVAVLPGSAFGSRGEGHIRISYSGSMETLAGGMDRLDTFFTRLQR